MINNWETATVGWKLAYLYDAQSYSMIVNYEEDEHGSSTSYSSRLIHVDDDNINNNEWYIESYINGVDIIHPISGTDEYLLAEDYGRQDIDLTYAHVWVVDREISTGSYALASNSILKFTYGGYFSGTSSSHVEITCLDYDGMISIDNVDDHKIFGSYTDVNFLFKNENVYPEWWGADPTGHTDSSAAINACVKFANSSCVKLRAAGEYLCESMINIGNDDSANKNPYFIGTNKRWSDSVSTSADKYERDSGKVKRFFHCDGILIGGSNLTSTPVVYMDNMHTDIYINRIIVNALNGIGIAAWSPYKLTVDYIAQYGGDFTGSGIQVYMPSSECHINIGRVDYFEKAIDFGYQNYFNNSEHKNVCGGLSLDLLAPGLNRYCIYINYPSEASSGCWFNGNSVEIGFNNNISKPDSMAPNGTYLDTDSYLIYINNVVGNCGQNKFKIKNYNQFNAGHIFYLNRVHDSTFEINGLLSDVSVYQDKSDPNNIVTFSQGGELYKAANYPTDTKGTFDDCVWQYFKEARGVYARGYYSGDVYDNDNFGRGFFHVQNSSCLNIGFPYNMQHGYGSPVFQDIYITGGNNEMVKFYDVSNFTCRGGTAIDGSFRGNSVKFNSMNMCYKEYPYPLNFGTTASSSFTKTSCRIYEINEEDYWRLHFVDQTTINNIIENKTGVNQNNLSYIYVVDEQDWTHAPKYAVYAWTTQKNLTYTWTVGTYNGSNTGYKKMGYWIPSLYMISIMNHEYYTKSEIDQMIGNTESQLSNI